MFASLQCRKRNLMPRLLAVHDIERVFYRQPAEWNNEKGISKYGRRADYLARRAGQGSREGRQECHSLIQHETDY